MGLKFYATLQYLAGQPNAGVVEMRDGHGQWAGVFRVDVRQGGRAAVYEEGYRLAAMSASFKNGRLELFSAGGLY